jgi:FkbM family methyltransferase
MAPSVSNNSELQMDHRLTKAIKAVSKKLNLGVTRHGHLEALKQYEHDIAKLIQLPTDTLNRVVNLAKKSRSQQYQDVFALGVLDFKRDGFFVEFGATDGIELSNSFLMEKEFGWTGILAEPARCWHEALKANRSSHIETGCVWRQSNETITFNESDLPALSTISTYTSADHNHQIRGRGTTYPVTTISLTDLLDKYNAPTSVDYLSIDTEGSEYEILKAFAFDRYRFKVITCEHNYTAMRDQIFDLLTAKGYTRKFIGLSKWDDWYVHTA